MNIEIKKVESTDEFFDDFVYPISERATTLKKTVEDLSSGNIENLSESQRNAISTNINAALFEFDNIKCYLAGLLDGYFMAHPDLTQEKIKEVIEEKLKDIFYGSS